MGQTPSPWPLAQSPLGMGWPWAGRLHPHPTGTGPGRQGFQDFVPCLEDLGILLPHPPGPVLRGQDTPLRAVLGVTLRGVTGLRPVPSPPPKDSSPGPTSSWPQAPSRPACRFSGRSFSRQTAVSASAPSSCPHWAFWFECTRGKRTSETPSAGHHAPAPGVRATVVAGVHGQRLHVRTPEGLRGPWDLQGTCAGTGRLDGQLSGLGRGVCAAAPAEPATCWVRRAGSALCDRQPE